MIEWLSERNVILVEQPLPKENVDDLAWLNEKSPLPIIADEAVLRLNDILLLQRIFIRVLILN